MPKRLRHWSVQALWWVCRAAQWRLTGKIQVLSKWYFQKHHFRNTGNSSAQRDVRDRGCSRSWRRCSGMLHSPHQGRDIGRAVETIPNSDIAILQLNKRLRYTNYSIGMTGNPSVKASATGLSPHATIGDITTMDNPYSGFYEGQLDENWVFLTRSTTRMAQKWLPHSGDPPPKKKYSTSGPFEYIRLSIRVARWILDLESYYCFPFYPLANSFCFCTISMLSWRLGHCRRFSQQSGIVHELWVRSHEGLEANVEKSRVLERNINRKSHDWKTQMQKW